MDTVSAFIRQLESEYSTKELFFNKEEHLKKLKKEFQEKKSLPKDFPEIVFDNKLDGFWESSFVIASKFFKKPICEFSFSPYELDYSLLEFLENNASCIMKTGMDSTSDASSLFLYENVFFYISTGSKEDKDDKLVVTGLTLYYSLENEVPYSIIEKFKKPREPEKPKIGIIKHGRGGMYVSKLSLPNNFEFSLDHYNDDFKDFEEKIIKILSEKTPGLFLFHGAPGTGKSSAIRHLVNKVKRNFIFIPPQMINQLSTPEFADIITDTHKGSVLILEDAEKALMKRESDDGFSNSALVSSVLNLTDGLYADLGQLAIIATYNCDRNLIDPALLRKGRLKAEYRFDKLNKIKAQRLADKIQKNITVEEDMSIADIFNHEDQLSNNEREEKRAIGFGFGG